jgi:hypothetical protein
VRLGVVEFPRQHDGTRSTLTEPIKKWRRAVLRIVHCGTSCPMISARLRGTQAPCRQGTLCETLQRTQGKAGARIPGAVMIAQSRDCTMTLPRVPRISVSLLRSDDNKFFAVFDGRPVFDANFDDRPTYLGIVDKVVPQLLNDAHGAFDFDPVSHFDVGRT